MPILLVTLGAAALTGGAVAGETLSKAVDRVRSLPRNVQPGLRKLLGLLPKSAEQRAKSAGDTLLDQANILEALMNAETPADVAAATEAWEKSRGLENALAATGALITASSPIIGALITGLSALAAQGDTQETFSRGRYLDTVLKEYGLFGILQRGIKKWKRSHRDWLGVEPNLTERAKNGRRTAVLRNEIARLRDKAAGLLDPPEPPPIFKAVQDMTAEELADVQPALKVLLGRTGLMASFFKR